MRVDDFDFDLPAEAIALHPARPRDSARLLVVQPAFGDRAGLTDRHVFDLPGLLAEGDVLVVNDTRVIPAKLAGIRSRGTTSARIDAMLHRRESAAVWRAFVRPAKKLAVGEAVTFATEDPGAGALTAEVIGKGEGGEVILRFEVGGADLDARLQAVGAMPLPPYIGTKRAPSAVDDQDYQTMFARQPGAVAAPTAGLHFTPALRAGLEARGIDVATVTLHVGAGTFLPVKAEDTDGHVMHEEWGSIEPGTADRLNVARAAGGRIVAVGTTSLRILETATGADGQVQGFTGLTDIFITPGYRFKAVDLLMTNFHLPRSTLFMLVSAFAGLPLMQAAYAHAIRTGYRFYSYGDACLLHPAAAAARA